MLRKGCPTLQVDALVVEILLSGRIYEYSRKYFESDSEVLIRFAPRFVLCYVHSPGLLNARLRHALAGATPLVAVLFSAGRTTFSVCLDCASLFSG